MRLVRAVALAAGSGAVDVVVGIGVAVAIVSAVLVLGIAARQRFVVVSVRGDSMRPTYSHADRLLVRRVGIHQLVLGAVVVATPPDAGPPTLDNPELVIKRLHALPGDPVPRHLAALSTVGEDAVPADQFVVLGDNVVSVDSRQLGYFSAAGLLGVVVRRLR